MMLARFLLTKADRSLRAASRLLELDHIDSAASRAYYGFFYVAQALLDTQGLRFSSHGQVLAQYGRLFAKTKLLDPKFHRTLSEAFQVRQSADYTISMPDPEVIEDLIQEGHRFIDEAFEYIRTTLYPRPEYNDSPPQSPQD